MTTYFPFTPSSQGAPSFQPTLDGNPYNIIITWNLYGQRYYLNCYDGNNVLVFCVPIIETAQSLPLQSLTWDALNLQVDVVTSGPHGFPIGGLALLTIAEVSPDGYNGAFACSITGADTFSYSLSSNPGTVSSAAGNVSFLVSLCAGYFSQSTLVFRNGQFEVNP